MQDAGNPDDLSVLVGNDNDFKAPQTIHNGQVVGTNGVVVDHMLLAYRVTLPGVGAPGRPMHPLSATRCSRNRVLGRRGTASTGG